MPDSSTSAHEISTRVGSTSGVAHVLGNAIFFEVAGQGHPIVILHDGLVHRAGFEPQIDLFSASFTTICYDRPGYGDSGPPTSDHSHVEMLAGLLDYLGLQAAILIGGSRGGGIAIDSALRYPERVSARVLVGAPVSGFAFSDHMLYRGWKNTWGDTIAEMIEFLLNDPWLIAEQNQQAKARFRELLEAYPLNLQDFPVKILDDGHAIDRLSEIAVPVLVMVGEWDIADNHAHAGVIQAGVKNTERIVVSDAGYLIYMEQPQVVNRRMMEFLEREGLHGAA